MWVNVVDNMMKKIIRFLHSAWSSWHHNRNTITELNSLFHWLAVCFVLSTRTSEKFWKAETRFTISILYRIVWHDFLPGKSRKWLLIEVWIHILTKDVILRKQFQAGWLKSLRGFVFWELLLRPLGGHLWNTSVPGGCHRTGWVFLPFHFAW